MTLLSSLEAFRLEVEVAIIIGMRSRNAGSQEDRELIATSSDIIKTARKHTLKGNHTKSHEVTLLQLPTPSNYHEPSLVLEFRTCVPSCFTFGIGEQCESGAKVTAAEADLKRQAA